MKNVDVRKVPKFYYDEEVHGNLKAAIEKIQSAESYTLTYKDIQASSMMSDILETGFKEYITDTDCYFVPFDLTYDKYGQEVYSYRENETYGYKKITDELYNAYYEATNEFGLSMAGLNFPGNADYKEYIEGKDNITPFEFIPWILCQCKTISEVKECLSKMNLFKINFSEQLPLSPLHWMISDKNCSIVVESVKDGLKIYDNSFEVLTNNPPFDYHCMNMNNYMGLTVGPLKNEYNIEMNNYSLGMGALGLPGDFSSVSRFVRATFVKKNSVCKEDENSSVNQFFHILNSVAMPKGCVWTPHGFEYTRYSSCCNVNKGIYYYMTYHNYEINSINMHKIDLNQNELSIYKVKGLDD